MYRNIVKFDLPPNFPLFQAKEERLVHFEKRTIMTPEKPIEVDANREVSMRLREPYVVNAVQARERRVENALQARERHWTCFDNFANVNGR